MLGVLIRDLRITYGIAPEQLADGLCLRTRFVKKFSLKTEIIFTLKQQKMNVYFEAAIKLCPSINCKHIFLFVSD